MRFLIAILFVIGCTSPESLDEEVFRLTIADGEGSLGKDCSGEHPENGCDDCNPCSWDAWCNPDEWKGFVPEWCQDVAMLGYAVCVHLDRTTPKGQINDCFPIAPETDVRSGKCCAGTCVDNQLACEMDQATE